MRLAGVFPAVDGFDSYDPHQRTDVLATDANSFLCQQIA
jgi:hypothetical protein